MKTDKIVNEKMKLKWAKKEGNYVQVDNRMKSTARATAAAICRLGHIVSGQRVIELGCGHGRIAEAVATIVNGLEYTGVDFTQALLDEFVLQNSGLVKSHALHCADIHSLPFNDAQFDIAFSSRVFQYLENPVTALREAHRTLRKGSRAVIAVPNRLNPLKAFYADPRLVSPYLLAHWFKECGFCDIRAGSCIFWPYPAGWNSVFFRLELLRYIPGVHLLGGAAIVSGIKQ